MASFIRTWLVEGNPAKLVRQLILGMSTRRNLARRIRMPGGVLRTPPPGRRVPVRFLGFEADEEGGLMPAPVEILRVNGRRGPDPAPKGPGAGAGHATGERETDRAA